MQDKERVLDSLLEVLKERILKKEDCEKILNQIGFLTVPKLVACRVLPLKTKFQFVDKAA